MVEFVLRILKLNCGLSRGSIAHLQGLEPCFVFLPGEYPFNSYHRNPYSAELPTLRLNKLGHVNKMRNFYSQYPGKPLSEVLCLLAKWARMCGEESISLVEHVRA